MYGWRGKIGLILPSLNNAMEPEFNEMAPNGVSIYATRLFFEKGLPEDLENMATDLEKAVDLLKTADIDGIVYGCTSGSLIKGAGWDIEIINKIEKRSGVPATATATAVVNALKELKTSSVAIATPYIDEVNDIEKAFFESHGFKVVNIQGLGYTTGKELHKESPESAFIFGKKVDHPNADCLFISCTDFPTISVIKNLEQDINKPVISSNTASLWEILRKIGINSQIDGFGQILRRI